ncbi:MAG: hypothetical protein A2939_04015 [Parcubacteria group bacterium RIFCSPLOWO2_01_FULL_48_18]|nr:MAG: hypothetical protein A2939_04015 [Parcubacteria group bacterium RIFCSPLOWO2_01_FULL_48_18]OHB23325.1 MAG: hypothetical protein A3J67_06095 [Parcubacteria group bacterium RIFCSPHIGHO2_02_FULL_48_10b]
MDKIVLDIETKNSFADVGGREYVSALEVSLVGAYSYNRDEYFCFGETQLNDLAEVLRGAGLVVGFALQRFDFPVLAKYMPFDIFKLKHLDILEEIEGGMGRRIGLGVLAEANLGMKKTGHGLESIELYKQGKLEELKDYCLNDVKLTKELYDLALKQGYLLIPSRNDGGVAQKVNFDWSEEILPQATLF